MKDFLHDRPSLAPLKGSAAPVASQPQGGFRAIGRMSFEPAAAAGDASHESCKTGEPRIELSESNGRIEQIIVTCACGQRITLQCDY